MTTCLAFRHFGTPVSNPPRCNAGGDGAGLQPQPKSLGGGTALCLLWGPNVTQASVAYNFPGTATGRATVILRATAGFAGARLTLADHYAPSFDPLADAAGAFSLKLNTSDLPNTDWQNVTLAWTLAGASDSTVRAQPNHSVL